MGNYTNQYPGTQVEDGSKMIMNAGADTTVFKPHSCRSASVNKVKLNGVPTSVILEKGCWKRKRTFKKFYYEDVINNKIQGDELKYTSSFILK